MSYIPLVAILESGFWPWSIMWRYQAAETIPEEALLKKKENPSRRDEAWMSYHEQRPGYLVSPSRQPLTLLHDTSEPMFGKSATVTRTASASSAFGATFGLIDRAAMEDASVVLSTYI